MAAGPVQMRSAAHLQDTSERTPAHLVPARELFGDMLLESGNPTGALNEYEASLRQDPGVCAACSGLGKRLHGRATVTIRGISVASLLA